MSIETEDEQDGFYWLEKKPVEKWLQSLPEDVRLYLSDNPDETNEILSFVAEQAVSEAFDDLIPVVDEFARAVANENTDNPMAAFPIVGMRDRVIARLKAGQNKKPQRQDAMRDQMDDLLKIAVKEGMYDAHQFIVDVMCPKTGKDWIRVDLALSIVDGCCDAEKVDYDDTKDEGDKIYNRAVDDVRNSIHDHFDTFYRNSKKEEQACVWREGRGRQLFNTSCGAGRIAEKGPPVICPSCRKQVKVQPKIVCHAEGDRCHGCPHYHGKADECDYAPKSGPKMKPLF